MAGFGYTERILANRSYLYALDNRPTSYSDRPDSIEGLSEWAYDVPFVYYLLLSGEPSLCASLLSDGFEEDEPDQPTRLYALSGDFATGLERLRKFSAALSSAAPASSTQLREAISEALQFLEAHQDKYFLLETIELDSMSAASADELREYAEAHLESAKETGAAVDALCRFSFMSGWLLKRAVQSGEGKFAPFKGLRLTDDFDHRDADRVLGMGEWSEVLYFAPSDKETFDAR